MGFFRWNLTGRIEHKLVIIPSSTEIIPASGGTISLSTVLITYRNGSELKRTPWEVVYNMQSSGSFRINENIVEAPNRGTFSGDMRSVDVIATGWLYDHYIDSEPITIYQEANDEVYDNLIFDLQDYNIISAEGGTSSPIIGDRYHEIGYTSGSVKTGDITIKSWSISDSDGGASIDENGVVTYGNNTSVSPRSVTVNVLVRGLKVFDHTFSAVCGQEAGARVYQNPSVSLRYDSRDAAGGTLTPYITASQLWTWNGVSGSGGTLEYTSQSPISGPTFTFSIKTPCEGMSLDPSTGIVTWEKNTGVSRSGEINITCNWNGKSASTYAEVRQLTNSVGSYSDITITNFSVKDIPASGGTISSGTYTATQTIYYSSGDTAQITSGFTASYSEAVRASSKGVNVSDRTSVGTLTLTLTLNGKTASKTIDVYQEANQKTLKGYSIELNTSNPGTAGSSLSALSAGGGYVNLLAYAEYSYTSRASNYEEVNRGDIGDPMWGSNSWITDVTGTTQVKLLVDSFETVDESTRTKEIWYSKQSDTGVTYSTNKLRLTQVSGGVTYGDVIITLTDTSYDIPAAGGTFSSTSWEGFQRVTYASGSYIDYDSSSITRRDKTGGITAENLGTTLTERTYLGRVEWYFDGLGGKTTVTGTDVYQQENRVEGYGDWEISLSCDPGNIPETGGSKVINVSATRTKTYTSTAVELETGTPVLSIPATPGVTLANNTITFTNNTTLSAKVVTVTATIGDVTKTITITQNTGYYSYGDIIINNFSYPRAPRAGGSVSPSLTYSQSYGWNGNTSNIGTITIGATTSYSRNNTDNQTLNTSTGVVTWEANVNVSDRSITVTVIVSLNGKTASKSAECVQAGIDYTYSVPVVSLTVPDIPASGGTVSSGTCTYTQTYGIDGNTSGAGTITSGATITYSAAVIGDNLSYHAKPRTKLGTLTVTVTLNDKTGTATADVYQEANVLERIYYAWPDMTNDGIFIEDIADIPASGGTISSCGGYYYQEAIDVYTSGDEITQIDLYRGNFNDGSVTFNPISAPSLGTTITPRTQIGTLGITINCNGIEKSKVVPVYQAENKIESTTIRSDWEFKEPDTIPKNPSRPGEPISANGGTYIIHRYWERSVSANYTSGAAKINSERDYPERVAVLEPLSKGISANLSDLGTITLIIPSNYDENMYRKIVISVTSDDYNHQASCEFIQASKYGGKEIYIYLKYTDEATTRIQFYFEAEYMMVVNTDIEFDVTWDQYDNSSWITRSVRSVTQLSRDTMVSDQIIFGYPDGEIGDPSKDITNIKIENVVIQPNNWKGRDYIYGY